QGRQNEVGCGGCHYQHMPYDMQVQAKTDILRDQFQRIGRIAQPPIQPMVTSPRPWNYRNHMQFHLNEAGKLGFEAWNSNRVIPIQECHLPEEPIAELWPRLDIGPQSGIERVAVRSGFEQDLLLVLESDSSEIPELMIETGISVVHAFEGHSL